MGDRLRSLGAMLITAPSEHEVLYQMAVRVSPAELVAIPGYALAPWMSIRTVQHGPNDWEVSMSAGVKAKRITE